MPIDEMPADELTTRLQADARRTELRTRPLTVDEIESRRAATTTWPAPRRATRTRAVVALALAIALSITTIVVWSASRSADGGARRIHVTTPSPNNAPQSANESVHPERRAGSLLYLEPTYVPADFTFVSAEGPDPNPQMAGSAETTAAQFWVRFNRAHTAATATLDIQWGPGARALPHGIPPSEKNDPLAGWRHDSVGITVRGRSGLYSSRLGAVAWEEPPGQAVSVDCEKCAPAELVQIANRLVTRADGGFTWPAPNDRFEFVNESPGMQSLGTAVRQVTYRGPNDTGFMIAIADDTDEPPFSQLAMPNVQMVDLRNTQGIIGPRMNAPLVGDQANQFMADPTLLVQWLEYPNVAVTVAGRNMRRTELLAVANGLGEISADRWARLAQMG